MEEEQVHGLSRGSMGRNQRSLRERVEHSEVSWEPAWTVWGNIGPFFSLEAYEEGQANHLAEGL